MQRLQVHLTLKNLNFIATFSSSHPPSVDLLFSNVVLIAPMKQRFRPMACDRNSSQLETYLTSYAQIRIRGGWTYFGFSDDTLF